MNNHIHGDAANADKIKAAFEKLGYEKVNVIHIGDYANERLFVFTENGKVRSILKDCGITNIIKTHPDYKELELTVKPKFKVGDWIVDNEGVFKITQYEDEHGYDLTDTTGCVVHFVSPDYVETKFHLWTIQDAKDGDVLVCYSEAKGSPIEQAGIFKQYVGRHGGCSNTFLAHTGIDWDGNIIINGYMGSTNILPATKEQRKLLFTKMRKVGYEWDVEKKELRKIQPHYDIANFKPFDKVLGRISDINEWRADYFSHLHKNKIFAGIGHSWFQCIPFEGNEHLLGTSDPCDEQYINW